MPGALTQHHARLTRQIVSEWPDAPGMGDLNEALVTLARWRARVIAKTYVAHQGTKIWSGPFAGMDYVDHATEGSLIARLLGSYESELHPHLADLAAEGLDRVIDVGCAEGYYAVGLARMMPGVTVNAYDIEEKARVACAELAARNGVAERVVIGGEFRPEDFAAFAGERVLVMVDTEGAEVDILQPVPALASMNIIVETHDVFRKDALQTLLGRFSATHQIQRINQQPKTLVLPDWLQRLSHLDQMLAVWEWRAAPTPWLVMRPKAD